MADISIVIDASALPKLLADEQKIVPGVNTTALASILGDTKLLKGNLSFESAAGVTVDITVNPSTAPQTSS